MERVRELAVLDALLEDGGAVVIEGGAGIGKTSLVEQGCRGAWPHGRRVLRARGAQLETGFAFGVVRQLFERELALVKVRGTGEKRVESLRIADIFRARVVDATIESFVFEMTGSTDKLNAFINLMRPLGLVDVARTGVAAIARGPETL